MVLEIHETGFDAGRIEAVRVALMRDGLDPGANGFLHFASAPGGSAKRTIFNMLARLFWEGPIVPLYRAAYGTEPLLLVSYSGIRQHRGGGAATRVSWHLDANFVGFGGRFLTSWVPLVEVGTRAPGLEFCVPRDPMEPTAVAEAWRGVPLDDQGRKVLDDSRIPGFLGEASERFALRLSPGGYAAFDQFVLHRTQIADGMNEDRLAVEFRACDRDDPAPDLPPEVRREVVAMWLDRSSGGLTIGPLTAATGDAS